MPTTPHDTAPLTNTFKMHYSPIFILFVTFFPPHAACKERIPGRKYSSEQFRKSRQWSSI